MEILKYILCLVLGYLIGSISNGLLIAKIKGVDLRNEGSGGTGTTNVLRTMGKLAALMTFVGDLAKVILPIVLIRIFLGNSTDWYLLSLYYGLGAVLGHCYPLYFQFKGGKGIAVTTALICATSHPKVIIYGVIAFVLVVVITRYVSVGSLLVVPIVLVINTIMYHRTDELFVHMLIISLLIGALDYFRHRANIVRLFHGEENKLF
ncbi:MAG: glycerol-3-phosphate 1-O-acyltransferase PlsY [Lachnospiraceae bacterium]|nr:glycerol-3-phosphate 1-O-acyltransferase PlsY [Lachnospiraceae bacterium]